MPTDAKRLDTGSGHITSNFARYPFLVRTEEGFWCRYCKFAYENGKITFNGDTRPWVTVPVSKANARKIGEKSAKHAKSSIHVIAEKSFQDAFSR